MVRIWVGHEINGSNLGGAFSFACFSSLIIHNVIQRVQCVKAEIESSFSVNSGMGS